jgi:hypothetical protein
MAKLKKDSEGLLESVLARDRAAGRNAEKKRRLIDFRKQKNG